MKINILMLQKHKVETKKLSHEKIYLIQFLVLVKNNKNLNN